MRLSELEYGSLLSYTPRGDSTESRLSRNLMIFVKRDLYVRAAADPDSPIPMSQWMAETIRQHRATLPFASFFQSNTILIPTPKSSLMQPGTLWVPERIATALVKLGIGKEVVSCLIRVKPVRKAASSAAEQRPVSSEHYESMEVQGRLSEPDEIVLIDDIVTRGATLLGAANRLADAFPKAHIRAFAAMRTISDPSQFEKSYDPCIGTIMLRASGDTLRRP